MAEMVSVGMLREKQNLSVNRSKWRFLTGNSNCSWKSWWVNYQLPFATGHEARESVHYLGGTSWVDTFHFPCQSQVLLNPVKESFYSIQRRIRLTNHNNIKNFYFSFSSSFFFFYCCVKFHYYAHSFVPKWEKKTMVNLCTCSTQLILLNIQSCCFIPLPFFKKTV